MLYGLKSCDTEGIKKKKVKYLGRWMLLMDYSARYKVYPVNHVVCTNNALNVTVRYTSELIHAHKGP